MIKTAIAGADTPMSGELIRILVNHPDVELVWAYAPNIPGRKLTDVHHGLIGETELSFSSAALPNDVDLLFIDAADPDHLFDISTIDRESIKIIDMSHISIPPFEDNDWAYGLSELFRKNLVRNGRKVVVPGSIAAVSLIALYPLAAHLMLSGNILIKVVSPDDISSEQRIQESETEVLNIIKEIQLGFNGSVKIERSSRCESQREVSVEISIPCTTDLETVKSLYEEMYADHNFTFISSEKIHYDEVVGTDKCVICLEKNGDTLNIYGVADCRMRGGAGDAVHALNLLFGLHEKTGLYLKAHKY